MERRPRVRRQRDRREAAIGGRRVPTPRAIPDGSEQAVFPAEVLAELYGTLGDVRDLLTALAAAAELLVVVAVALAVVAMLAQRRRQAGALRALGASRAYVMAAVCLYVGALVVAGALLGLGWIGAVAIGRLVLARTGIAVPIGISTTELAALALLVAAGFLAALVPAWASYRQSVSAALRS